MSYTPNFKNQAVKNRIQKCVEFVDSHIKSGETKQISKVLLEQYFSNCSRQPSKWIYNFLLEVVDPHYNMSIGKCKIYRKRPGAVKELRRLAGLSDEYVPSAELQQQIDTGEFEYSEKSDRWYSTAQYISSERRSRLLANNGYKHSYDIKAAAPAILFQRARQVNRDFQAPALENYIKNRSQVRQQIAREADTTPDVVKDVINSLLQGSILTTFSTSKLFQKLNSDYQLVQRFKQSETLNSLRADLRDLWKCLRDEFERTYYFDCNNRKRTHRLSARDKSAYYRKFENEVARVIQRYLNKHSVRFLWVHDGWQCDKAIDPNELCARVRQQTGFVIELDWTMYED